MCRKVTVGKKDVLMHLKRYCLIGLLLLCSSSALRSQTKKEVFEKSVDYANFLLVFGYLQDYTDEDSEIVRNYRETFPEGTSNPHYHEISSFLLKNNYKKTEWLSERINSLKYKIYRKDHTSAYLKDALIDEVRDIRSIHDYIDFNSNDYKNYQRQRKKFIKWARKNLENQLNNADIYLLNTEYKFEKKEIEGEVESLKVLMNGREERFKSHFSELSDSISSMHKALSAFDAKVKDLQSIKGWKYLERFLYVIGGVFFLFKILQEIFYSRRFFQRMAHGKIMDHEKRLSKVDEVLEGKKDLSKGFINTLIGSIKQDSILAGIIQNNKGAEDKFLRVAELEKDLHDKVALVDGLYREFITRGTKIYIPFKKLKGCDWKIQHSDTEHGQKSAHELYGYVFEIKIDDEQRSKGSLSFGKDFKWEVLSKSVIFDFLPKFSDQKLAILKRQLESKKGISEITSHDVLPVIRKGNYWEVENGKKLRIERLFTI
ncbi:MAG: hypothetical protein AAGA64_06385 [Bacteroidota bacterium]